jgi:hypothetical protein
LPRRSTTRPPTRRLDRLGRIKRPGRSRFGGPSLAPPSGTGQSLRSDPRLSTALERVIDFRPIRSASGRSRANALEDPKKIRKGTRIVESRASGPLKPMLCLENQGLFIPRLPRTKSRNPTGPSSDVVSPSRPLSASDSSQRNTGQLAGTLHSKRFFCRKLQSKARETPQVITRNGFITRRPSRVFGEWARPIRFFSAGGPSPHPC